MTVSPLSTARAMTFRSSRTLPGHAQPLASASASSERRGTIAEPVAAREQPQKVGRKRLDVLEALAKRRDRDRKDVEAIKEVFAKASLLHHASQVPVRRADDAHVDRHLLVAAHAPEGLALQHAKELRLDAGGKSPTSSRKSVPWSACSKSPMWRSRAPVKAPRSKPKSSLSIRLSGKAAQLTRTKGALRLRDICPIAVATTSFPTPDSPVSITVAS